MLQKFQVAEPCSECGSTGSVIRFCISRDYCRPTEPKIPVADDGEHLHHECRACGHRWIVGTLKRYVSGCISCGSWPLVSLGGVRWCGGRECHPAVNEAIAARKQAALEKVGEKAP